ncbi:MAG: hypothetical protein GKR89_23805 [Candidatus Latescibacteria bacterium]|nr:hypothetical protein [Candidatus Latescibacterota bacterium]
MSIPLPAQANLEHLKNQAKQLLKAHREQQSDAVRRVADQPVALPLSLQGAQRVVAREYGFASWPRLVAVVRQFTRRLRFAPRAKRVLEQGAAYARGRGDSFVDCPHLLGGMLLDPVDKGAPYLAELGADVGALRQILDGYQQQRLALSPQARQANLFTDGVKRVMQRAQDEAKRLHSPWVDYGHVLLGLLREEKGAGLTLKDIGLSLEEVRRQAESEPPYRVDWSGGAL